MLERINREMKFPHDKKDSKELLFEKYDYTILLGDLNFRIQETGI